MNPYLDEDLVTLGDHARRFANDRIALGFLERDKTRELERRLMREMGEMGFIAPELPQRFGGQGLGCLAAGVRPVRSRTSTAGEETTCVFPAFLVVIAKLCDRQRVPLGFVDDAVLVGDPAQAPDPFIRLCSA